MASMWFLMPCHGRTEIAALCIEHLSRFTIAPLRELGFDAQGVVISDEDEHLVAAVDWGLFTIEQENMPLGRKWNDGFELAGNEGADYFVPIGSDNWVDWRMLVELPGPREILSRRRSFIVHEDGYKGCEISVSYDGGDGIRTIPRPLLQMVDFRPAAEHARRAVDTSIVERLRRRTGWHKAYVYKELHPFQIVGWQSATNQLNSYQSIVKGFGGRETVDPWTELGIIYDTEMVDRMRDFYRARKDNK